MSITKLDCMELKDTRYSVYPYDGYNLEEILGKFYEAIKECNDLSFSLQEFNTWLIDVGLLEEVEKQLSKVDWDNIVNSELYQRVLEKLNETNEQLENIAINVKSLGAKGDGITDDTDIIQQALNTGKRVYLPKGVYVCTKELYFIHDNQELIGCGEGSGISEGKTVFDFEDNTTLLFKGTGVKQVRTRANHRKNASDPQDTPISVGLNIQANYVKLKDFAIRLNISSNENVVTNLGDNWDIGIFNGCRTGTYIENVNVVGYFRVASIYYDVTQGDNMPRFINQATGLRFPSGFEDNGGDGCSLVNVKTLGGTWGVKVQGSILENDGDTPTTYYDSESNMLVQDKRGCTGFSDFLMSSVRLHGRCHHTKYRHYDMSNDVQADCQKGGSYYISGFVNNGHGAMHGHRYFNCRFSTFDPIAVYLGRTSRDLFIGCHYDGFSDYYTVGGTHKNISEDVYGGYVNSVNTKKTKIVGCSANPYTAWWINKHDDYLFANDFTSTQFINSISTQFGVGDVIDNDSNIMATCGDNGKSRLYLGSKSKLNGFVIQFTASNNTLEIIRTKPDGTFGRAFYITLFNSNNTEIGFSGGLSSKATDYSFNNQSGEKLLGVTRGGFAQVKTGFEVLANGGGVKMRSPNGTLYLVNITDSGQLNIIQQ